MVYAGRKRLIPCNRAHLQMALLSCRRLIAARLTSSGESSTRTVVTSVSWLRHSGKALEVDGGFTFDGAHVQQWDYFGLTHQQWFLRPVN